MSDNPHKKQDFLDVAKHQLAQISAEVEKALEALKDPQRRQQMTSSYLDMLQKGLSKAQESVAKYKEKTAAQTRTYPNTDPYDSTLAPETSPTPQPMAAPPPESAPTPETPPTS